LVAVELLTCQPGIEYPAMCAHYAASFARFNEAHLLDYVQSYVFIEGGGGFTLARSQAMLGAYVLTGTLITVALGFGILPERIHMVRGATWRTNVLGAANLKVRRGDLDDFFQDGPLANLKNEHVRDAAGIALYGWRKLCYNAKCWDLASSSFSDTGRE